MRVAQGAIHFMFCVTASFLDNRRCGTLKVRLQTEVTGNDPNHGLPEQNTGASCLHLCWHIFMPHSTWKIDLTIIDHYSISLKERNFQLLSNRTNRWKHYHILVILILGIGEWLQNFWNYIVRWLYKKRTGFCCLSVCLFFPTSFSGVTWEHFSSLVPSGLDQCLVKFELLGIKDFEKLCQKELELSSIFIYCHT